MIEMLYDEMAGYFYDEGFKVHFETIDELSAYVYFDYFSYNIDNFYKKLTKATHKISSNVASLNKVEIVCLNETMSLLISVDDPQL